MRKRIAKAKRQAQRWLWRRSMAPLYGLAVGVVAILIYWPGIIGLLPGLEYAQSIKPLHVFDLRLGDYLQSRCTGRTPPKETPRICVVGIDFQGMKRFGAMPWPRERHAELVAKLKALEARVVAFDIFFPDGRSEDAAFAAAMRNAGNVVLPRCGLMPEPVPKSMAEVGIQFERGFESLGRGADGVFRTGLREVSERLYDAAFDVGHINIFYDDDLVARRVPVAIGAPDQSESYLPLGVVAAMAAQGMHASAAGIEQNRLVIGKTRIPLDSYGCIPISFRSFVRSVDTRPREVRELENKVEWLASGKRAPIEFYSFIDVLDGNIPDGAFKDAVVLVGQCVWGTREDLHMTPEGSQYGVFVQAMLLHTVLTGQFLSEAPVGWMVMSVLLLSLVIGAVTFSVRLRGSSYLIIGGGALLMVAAVVLVTFVVGLFRAAGVIVDVTPFALMIGMNLVGGIAINSARMTREVDRRNHEMDLLLVAGKRHMTQIGEHETPRAVAIPGAEQMAVSASLSLRSPEIVTETFWQTIPCDGCVLVLIGQGEALTFERTVQYGFGSGMPRADAERLAIRFAWETLKYCKPIIYSSHDHEEWFKDVPANFRTLLGVPVTARGHTLAVAVLFNKRVTNASPEPEFTEDHLRLVAALRYQAAALLENARRYQLEYAMFDGFARSLAKAVDFRDRYTRGHSERVAEFSAGIARELGLTDDEVEIVTRAATLHDLGKIGVNDTVLRKPGRLSEEEFALIRAHAANGFEILKAAPSFEPLLPGIRHHHERFDGRGYPDGLSGVNIPLLARIIAAADAYDAMTSDRIYRKALPETKARQELTNGAGAQFDPQIVKALLRYLDKRRLKKDTSTDALPPVTLSEQALPPVEKPPVENPPVSAPQC